MYDFYASGRARTHGLSSCVSGASVAQIGRDLGPEDKPGVHQGALYGDDEHCYSEHQH